MSNQPRLAVLIDADNIAANLCDELLQLCNTYGLPIIKRAYGDFTIGKAAQWVPSLAKHGISAHQNFPVASTKNAADISLVVDAMDILHANQIDGFCILSSDSDFTRLATRIRESGKSVYGFGHQNTPVSMQAACDQFKLICPPKQIIKTKEASKSTTTPSPTLKPETSHQRAQFLTEQTGKPYLKAYVLICGELRKLKLASDWISLDRFGKEITSNHSKINYKNFGGNKLSKVVKLVKETGLIETKGLATKDAKLRFTKVA